MDRLTVEGAKVDSAGHVVFSAGPAHDIPETTVRHTARPPFKPGDAPVTFHIGPVDFPDTAKDQPATGARFLNNVRGYSGTGMDNVEHYCLDCSFRAWLDATDAVTAKVVITRASGKNVTEELDANSAGGFKTAATLASGDTATITVRDAWGDTGAPATLST